MTCKQCSKQYTCNKEKCKPVKWSETNGYGIPERKEKWEKNYILNVNVEEKQLTEY